VEPIEDALAQPSIYASSRLCALCRYCHEVSIGSGEKWMWFRTGLNSIIHSAKLLLLMAKQTLP